MLLFGLLALHVARANVAHTLCCALCPFLSPMHTLMLVRTRRSCSGA